MLGQLATSTASSVDSRMFVYEVAGLSQDESSTQQSPSVRSSQNQFLQVPFHRMNQEMRRITLLGGEIVSIAPLNADTAASRPTNETESSTDENSAEPTEPATE